MSNRIIFDWFGVWLSAFTLLVLSWFSRRRKNIKRHLPEKYPPCAKWGLWIGPEVEGFSELGKMTLFVRNPAKHDIGEYPASHGIQRIWFCSEYRNWDVIRSMSQLFDTVCVEVNLMELCGEFPPLDIRLGDKFVIYYKLPLEVKKGDHLCVGLPFSDESFLAGTGTRVSPSDYLKDERIL